jgi:predicted nucleic acid-binding protein
MAVTGNAKESQPKAKVKRAVFLDTSGWIAAAIRSQARHEAAKAAYTAAVRQGYRIVLTPMVLGESQALFLRLLGREKALAAIESAMADPTHVSLPVDETLVKAAIERWLRPYRDQNFSLCDAVSFEIMKREGITRALSIDQHFVSAGFEIVAGASS